MARQQKTSLPQPALPQGTPAALSTCGLLTVFVDLHDKQGPPPPLSFSPLALRSSFLVSPGTSYSDRPNERV